MWNRRLTVTCLVLALTPASLVTAQETSGISGRDVDAYLKNAVEKYSPIDSRFWSDRMFRLLSTSRDPDATAGQLAEEDRLSANTEKALISLWITKTSQRERYDPESRQEFQQRAVEAVRMSGYTPFVTQLAVSAVAGDDCSKEFLDSLLKDAPNPLATGIDAANAEYCSRWWLALHARSPQHKGIRAKLSELHHELPIEDRLALLAGLYSTPSIEPGLRANTLFNYVSELWRSGLASEGLAVLSAASEADRQLLLNDGPLPKEMAFDGIFIRSEREDSAAFERRSWDLRLDYVAALFLTEKAVDARTAFEQLPYTPQLRTQWNCLDRRIQVRGGPCSESFGVVQKWRLLESVLNRANEDPYLLIEGGASVDFRSALWAEVTRRLLTGDNYAALRKQIADSWVRNQNPALPQDSALAEDVRTLAAAYSGKIATMLSQWNISPSAEAMGQMRTSSTPAPLPAGIRELSLPDRFRTVRSEADRGPGWPAGMTRLPNGFSAVRVERGTPYTIAVSLSQNLDPVGEVSSGAYWIHLSRDGGASWEAPLYTGLLQYFPYVVFFNSKMPLWSTDRITLEVGVKELDSTSITYPPVFLRSKRIASDLYLEIPLISLTTDSDHDGISDLVEDHLLLNKNNADSDGDGLADGADPFPNVKNAGGAVDMGYMTEVLRNILGTREDIILEPVDRAAGQIFGATRGTPPGEGRPLLIAGRPEDFAGVRLSTPVFVYSAADIERLRAHSVDFHALTVGAVTFNRAGDRGYLSWDRAWTGGTLRVIREGNAWRVEVINRWVS